MSFLGANAATYAGANLFSTGIKSIGQIISGSQQKGAYDQQAGVYEQQAEAARLKASLDEYKAKKSAGIVIGQQRAAYAAAGVNPNTGSPIDVMVDSLSNAYLDIEIEKYNNAVATARYESEAANQRNIGKQVKRESTFNAGLSLLQGGISFGQKMTPGKISSDFGSQFAGDTMKSRS